MPPLIEKGAPPLKKAGGLPRRSGFRFARSGAWLGAWWLNLVHLRCPAGCFMTSPLLEKGGEGAGIGGSQAVSGRAWTTPTWPALSDVSAGVQPEKEVGPPAAARPSSGLAVSRRPPWLDARPRSFPPGSICGPEVVEGNERYSVPGPALREGEGAASLGLGEGAASEGWCPPLPLLGRKD